MSSLADLLEAARTFDRQHPAEDRSWRKLNFDDGEGSTYFVQRYTRRVMRVRQDNTVEHGRL